MATSVVDQSLDQIISQQRKQKNVRNRPIDKRMQIDRRMQNAPVRKTFDARSKLSERNSNSNSYQRGTNRINTDLRSRLKDKGRTNVRAKVVDARSLIRGVVTQNKARGGQSRTVDARQKLNLKRNIVNTPDAVLVPDLDEFEDEEMLEDAEEDLSDLVLPCGPIRRTVSNEHRLDYNSHYSAPSPVLRHLPNSHNSRQQLTGQLFTRSILNQRVSIPNKQPETYYSKHDEDEDMEEEDERVPPIKPTQLRITATNSLFQKRARQPENTLISEKIAKLSSNSSAPKEEMKQSKGFKVMVENLSDMVTEDDISELFGDIGPLSRAKLLRVGQAEVTFENKEDAETSVDEYHMRQLDGQAMKCKLIPTAPPNVRSLSSTKSSVMSSGPHVTPDVSIVHRALFHKKNSTKS